MKLIGWLVETVDGSSFLLSHSSSSLLVGGPSIALWDTRTASPIPSLSFNNPSSMGFYSSCSSSSSLTTLVGGTSEGRVEMWDTRNSQEAVCSFLPHTSLGATQIHPRNSIPFSFSLIVSGVVFHSSPSLPSSSIVSSSHDGSLLLSEVNSSSFDLISSSDLLSSPFPLTHLHHNQDEGSLCCVSGEAYSDKFCRDEESLHGWLVD